MLKVYCASDHSTYALYNLVDEEEYNDCTLPIFGENIEIGNQKEFCITIRINSLFKQHDYFTKYFIISVIIEYIIVHVVLVEQYKNSYFSNCKCSHFVNINSQKENKSGQIIT